MADIRPYEEISMTADELIATRIARFVDRRGDWGAFADGEGNALHTHEVEELFFILRGTVSVFFEDEAGRRAEATLGPWDCVSCPAGVMHGYQNVGLEPAYLQVM